MIREGEEGGEGGNGERLQQTSPPHCTRVVGPRGWQSPVPGALPLCACEVVSTTSAPSRTPLALFRKKR